MSTDITDAQWERWLNGRCPICLTDPAAPDHPCHCGLDGDRHRCFDGEVYGPCGDENCGGACDREGRCTCACHKTEAAT